MFDVFYTGPKPGLFAFEKPAADIDSARAQARTEYFWLIDGRNDYTDFDWSWRPVPYEQDHTHVWPSHWQQNGGTCFVPTNGSDYKWHWRDDVEPIIRKQSAPIYYMDFGNSESQEQLKFLKQHWTVANSTRYVHDHLNVIKRIINTAASDYVWITSSICNYFTFDFTWHPAQWQEQMIHCFASNNQKRGDTFFIHVESLRTQMYDLELLDWFNVINYVEDIGVVRYEWPTHNYTGDNLVEEVKNYTFTTPYAVFSNQQDCYPHYNPCLWSEKDRVAESFTISKSICAVPRDAKAYIKTQIYDYPYLGDNQWAKTYFAEQPLDIVYISNGEPNEEEYYRWLSYNTRANFSPGKIHWVRGVNGRDAAYKAAAEASTTPWFFTVFAKLRVNAEFDFKWQPDYWQGPKHYIFHAKNPLNGLEYGHQAMIAYNKQLVLNTKETGLDFTLSAPHEVVPILSGVAEFNQDPWMTWRTAFREVLKLKKFNEETPTVENTYRLKKWLTVANGEYAEWCLRGAADAVEYYESVNGDFDKLKLSYEWAWLRKYFNRKTL
jgi:hypothetical protein